MSLLMCGCVTGGICGKAWTDSEGSPAGKLQRPGFLLLAPLTVAGDVATFPFHTVRRNISKVFETNGGA